MLATTLLATLIGSTPEPLPIVGGEAVVDDAWRSTVVIDLGVELCSGTLISERVVLTAAHCLQSSPPAELLQIKIGNSRADPELTLGVDHYAIHPEFCANIFACEEDLYDFAYVYLAEPAPADAVVPRLMTDQAAWDATMYTGAPVVLVGFGYDEQLQAGRKRAVEVAIRGFSRSGLELLAGGDGKDGCQGDSGGPVYARLPSGEIVLVAVSSRGFACGKGGYFGVTPPALCWIGEELGIVWDPGDSECGGCGCIETIPTDREPGCCSIAADQERPAGALGLLVVLALWRRRRQGATLGASPARKSSNQERSGTPPDSTV